MVLILYYMWLFNSGKQLYSRNKLVVFSKKLSGLEEAMRIRRYMTLKGIKNLLKWHWILVMQYSVCVFLSVLN